MTTINSYFAPGVTAVMLPELDLPEQIALMQKLGLTHYSVRPRDIADSERSKPYSNWGNHKYDLTPRRLLAEGKELRKRLTDAGITPFGTVPAVNVSAPEDVLKMHFEGAQLVGAGRVRIAVEPYPKTHFDYAALLKTMVEKYQRAVAIAKPYGQKIVIETHCFSFAASPALAWNICRHFDPADLGVIFDMANFNIEGMYQPVLAVAVLDKYIDHVHLGGSRRVAGSYDANGFRQSATMQAPITEAELYIPAWLQALADAGRHVPIIIEDFTENVPGALRLQQSAPALIRLLASLKK